MVPLRLAAAVVVILLVTGCATPVERRSLATGQPDREAYELNGADLPVLHREAQRLCPAGVDVVRSASQGPAPVADAGADADMALWRRWLAQARTQLAPSTGGAQLMIVCRSAAVPVAAISQAVRP